MYSSPDDKAKASASDGLYEPSQDVVGGNQYELLEVGVSVFSNFLKILKVFSLSNKYQCEYSDAVLAPPQYQTVTKQVCDLYTTPY